MFEHIFKNKKSDKSKLLEFGFHESDQKLIYATKISEDSFLLSIDIDTLDNIETSLLEIETEEEYILYKTNASGNYVTSIRKEIENVLEQISLSCFYDSTFKFDQTLEVISYASSHYGDELEFLWESSPNNAVLRRKDNQKWYAAILSVDQKKLGVDKSGIVEVLNLRVEPNALDDLIDNKSYFKAWHMNKKHWFSVILDGCVPSDELFQKISNSYEIASKK